MGEFEFPSGLHLKKPSDFRAVFDRGSKRHTKGFILFRAANRLDRPRLGVSVSRYITGAAVVSQDFLTLAGVRTSIPLFDERYRTVRRAGW